MRLNAFLNSKGTVEGRLQAKGTQANDMAEIGEIR
jgi:hypothetical protein